MFSERTAYVVEAIRDFEKNKDGQNLIKDDNLKKNLRSFVGTKGEIVKLNITIQDILDGKTFYTLRLI